MSVRGGLSKFADWKRAMLARRQLERPDGRDLYEYRLTVDEFVDLMQLLTESLERLSLFELALISQVPGFAGLFVLYAAERWRRRFDGTHWSWEPILSDIGAKSHEWNQLQRSECVRLGLQEWGLKPRATGGLRFLGSIAVQGGLPLRLLAEARGRIGHLLGAVFKLVGGTSVTPADLETWVGSLHETLPKSYRLEAIYRLLANVAWTVLRLKDEAQLNDATDAIERLNSRVPDWRERFPLPIEDADAQGLIEQLVRDAASVRPQRQVVCLPLDRQLEVSDDGRWTLHSSLSLPDAVPASALAKLFRASVDELPRAGELALTVGDRRLATTIRRMAGHERYRIERQPWGYAGTIAAQEHLLHLSGADGRVWSVSAPRGEVLDEDLPWVFSTAEAWYRFLRQGSGGVAVTEALVAIPAGWTVEPEGDASIAEHGQIESLGRQVFSFRGRIHTFDNTGLTCRIRTGQAQVADESYEWRGDRVWLDFRHPNMAFKGLPRLHRIGQDGLPQRMDGDHGWNVIGAAASAIAQPLGPLTVRYPASGDVRQRATLVALPSNARLHIEFQNAGSGVIKLENWGATTARVCTEGIEHKAWRNDNALFLSMQETSASKTCERVEVEVFWPHTTVPARLVLPFPARGVRAFDGEGTEIASGSLLAAQRLTGVRLSVLGGEENVRKTLEIGTGQGRPARIHQLRALPGALSVEVRLQDYATDVQHLLSTDDSPDARVRIAVRIGGHDHYRLDVARYAAKLDRNGSNVDLDAAGSQMLTPEEIRSLPVLALCLERPGDEAIALNSRSSAGVPTGTWEFSPESRDPGCWLIFPGADAQFPFRPRLWPIVGNVECTNALSRIIGIVSATEREAALDEVIDAMAADYLDPCWTELERLAGQVGHLPLATLDLWRRFARSPQGMASLTFRFGTLPNGFLDRFAQELPFVWETVPLSSWKQAMERLHAQCVRTFGEDAGKNIFQAHLHSRINDMTSGGGALQFLLGVATAEYSQEARQHMQLLKFIDAEQELFNNNSGLLMRLRQLHADDEWPTGLGPILGLARRQVDVARFLHTQPFGFPDGVINLPLLIAAQAATNQTKFWFADPSAIHLLRSHRAFDPEWFDEAYNLTIARCLAAGLIDT